MSVNLSELVPVRTLRYGGQVDWDDPIQIPNGLAIVCQNMQFLAESVKVRWGMRYAIGYVGAFGNPTGVDVLTVLGSPQAPTVMQQAGGGSVSAASLNPNALVGNNVSAYLPIAPNTQIALVFGDNGKLYIESPPGSGTLIPLPNTRIASTLAALLPTGSALQTAKAYNRIYQAYATFMNRVAPASSGSVLTLDAATGFESPVGQNPIAAPWQPNTLYQQGDIVVPTANAPSDVQGNWFRRNATGFSENIEPSWPQDFGFFSDGGTPGTYTPNYAETVDEEWTAWTPGFPSYLPTVQFPTLFDRTGFGGSVPSGLDVYVYTALYNDLGESIWSNQLKLTNTTGPCTVFVCQDSSLLNQGPFLPTWLMSVMPLGTVNGLHWPASSCVHVYVAAVATGNPAPTAFYLYGSFTADTAIGITAIPVSGTTYTVRTVPTAAVSSQQFMGEAGQRYAMLLRQNTMGDLSPAGTSDAIPVQFLGALAASGSVVFEEGGSNTTVYVSLDDITPFTAGMAIQVAGTTLPAGSTGSQTVSNIIPGHSYEWDTTTSSLVDTPVNYPAGILVYIGSGTGSTSGNAAASISVPAGPCPVAVVPPGTQEGPGYAYDILAFTVVGLSNNGPFNYLAYADPANPFSTPVKSETTDGNGNASAVVADTSGLSPGETVLISGWTGGDTALNGLRVLASVGPLNQVVTFPDGFTAGTYPAAGNPLMAVVQIQPTQLVAGTVGILLQFDDNSLPEGVDVTGNLLFVALPDCTDLAYLPSVSRMAYVSDDFPTTLIFSEEDFMGEVDGLNDILTIEPSNSSLLVGARELLNGTIIACKRSGGYQVVPTADVPARWGTGRLWGIHGPTSGRNIATGRDGSTGLDYILFVDPEAGLFKWPPTLGMGELDWLSKELSGANNQDASRMASWDRVNRAAGASIQVVVDDIAKEVKIAVPLDGATAPSHILTMSYFNGWQDPLMLTLSGEWVANRQSRRWNIDPIPTNCMAMVQRTLLTPVDQRVNYHQLLLGVPTYLLSSYATVVPSTTSQATHPTIAPGTYYAQLARVAGGIETAYSPVLGPFTVAIVGTGPYALASFQANLPGDSLEDSWTIYFGATPTTLTSKITGIGKTVTSYVVTTAGVGTSSPAGFVALTYMQPGAYDDLGAGYVTRYRPAYAKEAPSQAWPDGGRLCRFSVITGHALGAGQMLMTPVTDDPDYEPDPMTVALGVGPAEVPGSAPITHFNNGMKGDSEFLTVEFSNGGVPGAWFQLLFHTLWHKPLFPTR